MSREAALVPFEISDLDKMDAVIDVDEIYGDFKERLEAVLKRGDSKTIYYYGKILGAMGYFELWPGVCEVWIFMAKDIVAKGIFALIVRDALNKLIDVNIFHRVQATAIDNKINESFFTKLGFVDEGVLRQYSRTKQNYKMWSRVK